MHDIGLYLVKPCEQPPRDAARMKANLTVEACPKSIA